MSMPTWVAEPATPPRLGRRLGPPAQIHHGKVVAQAILHTRLVHGMLDGQFCELRYPSPTTGDDTTRLVRYAVRGTDLVVLAEMADHDQWWRTFTRPYPVHVLLLRRWRQGLGHAAILGQPAWRQAMTAFAERYPHLAVAPADIFVVVSLRPAAPHLAVRLSRLSSGGQDSR
ncbi:MAG TPA: hypothetical protein VJT31_24450 [Rugosimonospora sp.]|nr:hypothetical protein [Rugosimonospora sp.]